MELSKIPGLLEAVREAEIEEDSLREFAFTDMPETICGLDVKQFTPRHMLYLKGACSPYVVGGCSEPSDDAAFLWVVSEGFRIGDEVGRCKFVQRISAIPADWPTGIREYLDRAFFDMLSSSSPSQSSPVTSLSASIVHPIAKSYGWDDDDILDTPFARLFQYLRRITIDENPKYLLINRISDRVKREKVNDYLRGLRNGI